MSSFPTLRTVAALMFREMASTYGRSPGGYVWSILEPVGSIALMSALFSLGFRTPQLGVNFPIYYASGLLPFFMFIHISQKMMQSLSYSRQLLAYPRVTIIDALLARFILNVLTELLSACLILAGILLIFNTGTTLILTDIILGFTMAAALAVGIGTLNCLLVSLTPIWRNVWSVVTRPLMIISGILFLFDSVPEPYRGYLWYNPLVHAVGAVRRGFYYSYTADYVTPLYPFSVALITGAVGLLFLKRYHRDILEI
ncbi:MAG: ABC transporter permease [Rhodobacteraceae bacterium]|nr:ABC transporter permease [Paracoccaceae bacterium]